MSRHEPLSVRDQLAIWLAVHVAGTVRMDVVELADQILADPLRALVAAAEERDALRAAIHVVVTDLRGRSLSYVTRAKIDALARVLDDAEATP